MAIEADGLVNLTPVHGNVFRQTFLEKSMHNVRLVMRNLFLPETFVEVEQMAPSAIRREGRRVHVR